jgi:two-component system, sensor histidine kinase and response regulator
LGMTELLLTTQMSERQRHMAKTIHRSGTSLLGIINDILDFSKIEAGKLELEHIAFDVRQAVEEAVELFAEPAGQKELELTCFIPAETPRTVVGDPVRFRQILLNLVGNAVKFTQHGEVSVRVHCLAQETAQVRLKCEVQDTGIGITEAAQQRLFAPFSQADSSTTRRFGGTGLGLAIVRQLVGLMGGEIGIESTPDHGTTFWFTVQFGCDRKQDSQAPATTSSLAGTRILIVDDNATNRFILGHQLKSWDVDVLSADSAAQALEQLTGLKTTGTRVDMAILDIDMPDIDGIMLSQMIKDDPAHAHMPLIALSSVDRQSEQSNFVAWLRKPVRQSLLHDCLLRQHRLGAESDPARKGLHVPSATFNCRILLAEDNPVNREVALGMLEFMGCHVDMVEDGHQATEAAIAHPYDLILMDCQMPDMDGYAATATIRRNEAAVRTGGHVPIIALTANALEGDREKCLAAGMDDYLSKPFSQEGLRAILERWIVANTSSSRPTPPGTPDRRAA